MSDLNLVSPLLDDFDTGSSISEHHGVICYPAMRKESTDRYIIKQVSIPASQAQFDALLLTGAYADADSTLAYFRSQAEATVDELKILRRLSELEGFLSYDDWQVVPKDNAAGYDIYMIGTYKYTLRKYLQHHPATHLSAVNLGLDLCAALSVCRQLGYIYVDLTPNNIYVTDNGFRIGDIGFIQLDTLKYAALPEKYASAYTAPEAFDAFSTLTPSLDTYSVGMILYQIFNGGALPSEPVSDGALFPAPAYADYEMSEIIQKACDPNPEMRWQDPVEMAQALVGYMQRNSVNDTPIVPPTLNLNNIRVTEFAAENHEVDSAELSEANTDEVLDVNQDNVLTDDFDLSGIDLNDIHELPQDASAETEYSEDDFGNLSFLNNFTSDDTTPENNIEDVDYDEISDELSEILNQADKLVSQPIPEAVITIEQPVIDTEDENEDAPQDTFLDVTDIEEPESEQNISSDKSDDAPMDKTTVVQTVCDDSETNELDPETIIQEPEATDTAIEENEPVVKKKRGANWILTVVIFILIAAIAAVGFFYYRTIYLLPINSISVDGNESKMIVFVDTEIDETMLDVICSDSHGNQISAPVTNGTAIFSNLTPGTAYNVQIIVDGFHRLIGETGATYSTPALTNILQFTALTGAEDGSAVISFETEGPDTGVWQLVYSAPNEEEKTVDVLSHAVTLTGLTVGKEYTFELIPGEGMYVTGTTQITHVANNIVRAENVNIVSCKQGLMTVVWETPANVDVPSWTVRCYNDGTYNQSAITSDTTIAFEDVDPTTNYTVEVVAAGMSVSERAYMSANASTITNFTTDTETTSGTIYLTWESDKGVPTNGWVVLYSVDGTENQGSATTTENGVAISPVIPDATYTFRIQHADGTPALSEPLICKTASAQDFSGYGMERNSMTFQLCRRPGDNWDWDDIPDADFTSTYALGDSIGLVGKLDGEYANSDDMITAQYVIRDFSGNLIVYSHNEQTWNEMWSNAHTELNIPELPTAAGDYTLTVYFNGKFVSQKAFSLSE